MHSKGNSIEIMIKDDAKDVIIEHFNSLTKDTKITWNQAEKVCKSFIMFNCFSINVTKEIQFLVYHI